MRSLSADAAIVAAPTLGAAYLAVRSGNALVAVSPPGLRLPDPLLLLPAYAVLGLALTWVTYHLVAGLLRYRAISTSNGRALFIFLAMLVTASAAFEVPELALPFAAAAAGAAFALHLIRHRPSRRIGAN